MKLVNTKTKSNDYFNKYDYFFDKLNTADDIKEILNNLKAQGYNLKKIKFIYFHDDCICKPDIEYASLDDFNKNCNEIDEEELRNIKVELINNGIEIIGNINTDLNLLEIYVEKNETEILEQKITPPHIKR